AHDIPTRRGLLDLPIVSDDQASWAELVGFYSPLFYRCASKAGLSDADANEVVQETIIAVSKNIQNYDRTKGKFRNWLFYNIRWRIRDRFRKRQGEARASGRRSKTSTRTPTVEGVANLKEDLEAVWDQEFDKYLYDTALERVKQQVRAREYQIFDAYVTKGWPAQEVARTLNVSEGRVF